ncbi:MAG: hypothetical protein HY754_13405 [Nitrospirae bacterium]|nr:hypothetical protein [Nitrospirota bacterium]
MALLMNSLVTAIYTLIDIYFKESLQQILPEIIILLIIITPVIYFLLNRIVKLETEHKILKEKEELIKLSTGHAVLYEISDQFMKTYDIAKIMDIAVKSIYEYFNADFAKILIPDEKENCLVFASGIGWLPGYVGVAKIPIGVESQAGYTLLKRRPVMVVFNPYGK